jgi:hypothetical protein
LPDLSMNVLGGRHRKPVASLYGADNFESRSFVLAPVKNSAHRHAESLFENNCGSPVIRMFDCKRLRV